MRWYNDSIFWKILIYGAACMLSGFMWGAGMGLYWVPVCTYAVVVWIFNWRADRKFRREYR